MIGDELLRDGVMRTQHAFGYILLTEPLFSRRGKERSALEQAEGPIQARVYFLISFKV